ncbi:unnamed protein product [Trichobilharzia regenti]|nr:unnamed protein product [Trichobilharzia regenti]
MTWLNLLICLLLNGFVSGKRKLSTERDDTQHARKSNNGFISADQLSLTSDHPYYTQSISFRQKAPIEFTKSKRVTIPADISMNITTMFPIDYFANSFNSVQILARGQPIQILLGLYARLV